jgi:DNA repair protein RecN (Recombination protein N)
MGDAARWLEGAAAQAGAEATARLDVALAALGRALIELGEAQHGVEDCAAQLDFNPMDLEAAEERLFAIRAMARKHGVLPDDLGGFADGLRLRLAALDHGARNLGALQTAVASADAAYDAAAQALSAARRDAALRLDAAMAGELAPLKLERAVFTTRVLASNPGPEGMDEVVFEVATNPGAPSGALNRIASGGELSRFLLALKVCLTRGVSGLTLIFDEIDRGVGGATADAVGRRLAALAEGAQVLVVTHSPQVAARGAHHWRVQKAVADGATLSGVVPLDPEARVDEIARMLAGDTITAAARAAAEALLRG